MDRQIVYPGAIPLDTDSLLQARNAVVAQGRELEMLYGVGVTGLGGFGCVPGNGLSVVVAPGSIVRPGTVDDTAFGSLPAVSSTVSRQYVLRDPVTLSIQTAGATWTVYATASRIDTAGTVVPYYNAANPAQTLAGPGNDGLAQPSVRQDLVTLGVGQSVPSGAIALWTIVVPSGVTAITQGMIAAAAGAPFMPAIPLLAPKDRPVFTNGMVANYGSGYSYHLQDDGTAVWYTGGTALFAIGGTGAYTNQPFTAYANLIGKYDYVGNGSVGVGGSLSAGGPAANNFQFNGTDTVGNTPISKQTNGFFAANGGVFMYSTSAATVYAGTGVVNGPIFNLYSNSGALMGAILNNNNTGVSYASNSDRRLKDEIEPIDPADAEKRVGALVASSFHMVDADRRQRIEGFIADEWGRVYPHRTFGEKDGVRQVKRIDGFDRDGNELFEMIEVPAYQSIDMLGVIPDLVALVQSLMRRISALEGSQP